MNDLDNARAEAALEVCNSVLKAAIEAMKRHGDDPTNGAIIAGGFAMALKRIGEVDSRVPLVVCEMLR